MAMGMWKNGIRAFTDSEMSRKALKVIYIVGNWNDNWESKKSANRDIDTALVIRCAISLLLEKRIGW